MTILQPDWTGDQEVPIGGWQRHISGDSLADDIRRQWSLRSSLGYETHSRQGPFPQSVACNSTWRKSKSGETPFAPHEPVYVTQLVRVTPSIKTNRYAPSSAAPAAAGPNRIRRLNRSSSAKIRLLTRGDSSSIPSAAPSAAQSVIRDSRLASSIRGSGDSVASVGIDRPVGAWDRL